MLEGGSMEIGSRIRDRRVSLGLTQEELAERSDLTKGFISQVERDLTSPSLISLCDILDALGTNLPEFFKEEEDPKQIFSKDDYVVMEDEENGSEIKWLIPSAQTKSMEPIIIKIKKGGSSRTLSPSEGENFGYVLKGDINLYIGDNSYCLSEGDSFYCGCEVPRRITNTKSKEALVLWTTNPPSF